MFDQITRFCWDMQKKGTILSFSGAFSQGINEDVCDALESYVIRKEKKTNLVARLFSVYVEMSQNIRSYFQSKIDRPEVFREINNIGAIIIGQSDNRYYVASFNLLENRDIPDLVDRLESINAMDRDQLNAAYRRRLSSAGDANTTSGLGFLDIAKKCSGGLRYRFESRDEDYSFFYLEANIRENIDE